MKYAYLNTFVTSQGEDVQGELNELLAYAPEIQIETMYTTRKQLNAILDMLQPGDTLYVHSFARFCRGLKDLVYLSEIIIDEKGAALISLHDDFDSTTEKGKIAKDVYARAIPLLISDN
ncbi:recombinase family protein [Parasporobacterium paucivorans]|uniref:Resolvase, N terminal domain n=1 Tax=Parasporobacterium paucivorans DSM 15970 TaxID=1122934 RepID=A0A1M6EL85_9FIRM|nr:recombinase family protein [Parasporobacterium paucivorans]SHI86272.1 Resolvase, N terminal domain [Parasporobacterium paucivorans DSM 15970]